MPGDDGAVAQHRKGTDGAGGEDRRLGRPHQAGGAVDSGLAEILDGECRARLLGRGQLPERARAASRAISWSSSVTALASASSTVAVTGASAV